MGDDPEKEKQISTAFAEFVHSAHEEEFAKVGGIFSIVRSPYF
jgi:hypothetical protein